MHPAPEGLPFSLTAVRSRLTRRSCFGTSPSVFIRVFVCTQPEAGVVCKSCAALWEEHEVGRHGEESDLFVVSVRSGILIPLYVNRWKMKAFEYLWQTRARRFGSLVQRLRRKAWIWDSSLCPDERITDILVERSAVIWKSQTIWLGWATRPRICSWFHYCFISSTFFPYIRMQLFHLDRETLSFPAIWNIHSFVRWLIHGRAAIRQKIKLKERETQTQGFLPKHNPLFVAGS